MTSMSIIIIAAVALGALLMVLMGLRSRPKSQEDVLERMGRYASREDFLTVEGGSGKKEPNKLARSLEERMKGGSMAERVASLLARADVKMTVGEFILLRLIGALGGFAIGFLLVAQLAPALGVLAGIALAVVGYAIPIAYLSIRAKKRAKRFVDQLGDTISLMANSLRAGYSLLQTMETVSREVPDPMGTEFKRVVREVGLGIGQDEAMANLLRRVPSDDLDLLVTAINIQHEVGGNLAQILSIIGHTIRERVRIKGEIGVLTAQQAISGYVISVLPLGLGGALFLLNPSYMMGMFVWPYICMPIGAGFMMILGFFAMKKITAIEV